MTTRKIVVAVMVAGFLVPFIFMRTLFPFYRFGMFAEPVKGEAFEEKFEITYMEKGKCSFFIRPMLG